MKRIVTMVVGILLAFSLFSPVAFSKTASAAAVTPTIKILSIGNSFSRDAHTYVRAISNAAGIPVKTANLYIGGCSLQTHWNNANGDYKAYVYQLKEANTTNYQETQGVSIKQALEMDDWDYVTFQQASPDSGKPATYEPYLTNLSNYVKGIEPNAEQIIHQTWAYEINSTHTGFPYYGSNQQTMFNALKDANKKAANSLGVRTLPCGEAYQIARATAPFDYANGGKSLCAADTYHSSVYGMYVLGAVWFEVITGKSVLDNTYTISSITTDEMNVLKQAAHSAVALYNPTVTGVTNGKIYPGTRTITFSEGTATLNSAAFSSGSAVSTDGDYTFVLTNTAGNSTTVKFKIQNSGYLYAGGKISGIAPETYSVDFKKKINILDNQTIKLLNKSSQELLATDIVGTGTTVQVLNTDTVSNTYQVVIYGDVNGDGKINAFDLLALKKHLLSYVFLTDVYKDAADTNRDAGTNPNAMDLLMLKRHILNLSVISQK